MKQIGILLLVAACFVLAPDVKSEMLNDRLKGVFGDRTIEVIDYDDHLKAVVVDSKKHFFASHDGRYVYGGPVFDTLKKVDIIAERQAQGRQAILSAQSKDVYINYPSIGTTKHQITVFTDIDCSYCRKLHNTMADLNQRGISVNYVMLPRAGINSVSYAKTLNALCSEDPAKSITLAMQNEGLDDQRCKSTQLNQHMALARELGIRSTPTLVLPNGELRPGYLSAERVEALLNRKS